jgi:hypothetical protein
MQKFRTGGYGNKLIESVEIDRETESSVFIGKNRNAKRSSYHNYFDTWDDAKAFLLKNAEDAAASIRRQLEVANGKLGNIRGLRNQA